MWSARAPLASAPSYAAHITAVSGARPVTWSVRITIANGLRILGAALQVPTGIKFAHRSARM